MSGAKNLSLEQAAIFSTKAEFTELEQEYFFALIQLDRAGTQQLKQYWRKQIEQISAEHSKLNHRIGAHHELTDTERALYYSSWLYSAIFIATSISGQQSADQISQRFGISRDKTLEILNFLVRAGICETENGFYKMGKQTVYVPNNSPFVVKHHTNWRMRAIQKMDTREEHELFFSSPMSISKSDVAKIRDVLAQAVQKSQQIVAESGADELICLNIDFFRII